MQCCCFFFPFQSYLEFWPAISCHCVHHSDDYDHFSCKCGLLQSHGKT